MEYGVGQAQGRRALAATRRAEQSAALPGQRATVEDTATMMVTPAVSLACNDNLRGRPTPHTPAGRAASLIAATASGHVIACATLALRWMERPPGEFAPDGLAT